MSTALRKKSNKIRADVKHRNKYFPQLKCDIRKVDLDFFTRFIPELTIFTGINTTTVCESLSVHILNKLFPVRERKNYVITQYLGCGSSGYVMDVKYFNFHERSESTIIERDYILKLLPIQKEKKLEILSSNGCKIHDTEIFKIKNEINMQQSLREKLERTGDDDVIMIPHIIKEKELKKYGLYAILMEKIPSTYKQFPFTFLLRKGANQQEAIMNHKKYISMIVKAVHKIHEKGFIHGDVAYRNLFYNDRGTIAFIDFGRSVNIQKLSKYNQFMFKMYDYYCVLNEIFRSKITDESYIKYLCECLQKALVDNYIFDDLKSTDLSDDTEKEIFREFRDTLMKKFSKESLEMKRNLLDKYKTKNIFKGKDGIYVHLSVLSNVWTDPVGPYDIDDAYHGPRY